jgi:hypothetical protein
LDWDVIGATWVEEIEGGMLYLRKAEMTLRLGLLSEMPMAHCVGVFTGQGMDAFWYATAEDGGKIMEERDARRREGDLRRNEK